MTHYDELKEAAEVAGVWEMRVRGGTILALLAERDELLRVAEGVQARYINRGFFVPEDAIDLMQAIARVKP